MTVNIEAHSFPKGKALYSCTFYSIPRDLEKENRDCNHVTENQCALFEIQVVLRLGRGQHPLEAEHRLACDSQACVVEEKVSIVVDGWKNLSHESEDVGKVENFGVKFGNHFHSQQHVIERIYRSRLVRSEAKSNHNDSPDGREGSRLSRFFNASGVITAFRVTIRPSSFRLLSSKFSVGHYPLLSFSSEGFCQRCSSEASGHVCMKDEQLLCFAGPSNYTDFLLSSQTMEPAYLVGRSGEHFFFWQDEACSPHTGTETSAAGRIPDHHGQEGDLSSQLSPDGGRVKDEGASLVGEKGSAGAEDCKMDRLCPKHLNIVRVENRGPETTMPLDNFNRISDTANGVLCRASDDKIAPNNEDVLEASEGLGFPETVIQEDGLTKIACTKAEAGILKQDKDKKLKTNNSEKSVTDWTKCEAPSTAAVLKKVVHLDDDAEVSENFSETGICVKPVNDSISGKMIENSGHFSVVIDDSSSQQKSSWKPCVENCQYICSGSVAFDESNWNSNLAFPDEGKTHMLQQATKRERLYEFESIGGNCMFQDIGSPSKIKMEDAVEEPTPVAFFGGPSLGVYVDVLKGSYMADEAVANQVLDIPMNFFSKEGRAFTMSDAQLLSVKHEAEVSGGLVDDHLFLKEVISKEHFPQDASVEIMECTMFEDVRLDSEDQARECSSSFEDTQSGKENYATLDSGKDDEVESLIREGNGATFPTVDGTDLVRRKKKALNRDWKIYRQSIEWRCRWLELRIQELCTQAAKYERAFDRITSNKDQILKRNSSKYSASRTIPFTGISHRHRILQRKQRRKVEDIDYTSPFSKHPVYSRYEKKRRRNHKEIFAEKSYSQQVQPVEKDCLLHELYRSKEYNTVEEDKLTSDHDSMEKLLWYIEALQMRIVKLKNQLSRGAHLCKMSCILPAEEPAISSFLGADHSSQLENLQGSKSPQRPSGVSWGVLCSSRLSAKLNSSSKFTRKWKCNYDINDVFMPDNVMATYNEPVRHVFIETPQWRMVDTLAREDSVESCSSEEAPC